MWITNVCKYEVPPNTEMKKIPFHKRAKNHGIDIDQQLSELQDEIDEIKPNCILALGGTALWALSGKTKITKFEDLSSGGWVISLFLPIIPRILYIVVAVEKLKDIGIDK